MPEGNHCYIGRSIFFFFWGGRGIIVVDCFCQKLSFICRVVSQLYIKLKKWKEKIKNFGGPSYKVALPVAELLVLIKLQWHSFPSPSFSTFTCSSGFDPSSL